MFRQEIQGYHPNQNQRKPNVIDPIQDLSDIETETVNGGLPEKTGWWDEWKIPIWDINGK